MRNSCSNWLDQTTMKKIPDVLMCAFPTYQCMYYVIKKSGYSSGLSNDGSVTYGSPGHMVQNLHFFAQLGVYGPYDVISLCHDTGIWSNGTTCRAGIIWMAALKSHDQIGLNPPSYDILRMIWASSSSG